MKINGWENKTPHIIRRIATDGRVLAEYPPANFPLRVKQKEQVIYVANGTVIKRYVGKPEFKGLPDPIREDIIYIVSGIAASLIKRWNFVAPNSSPESVSRKGQSVFAVKSFTTFGSLLDDEKGQSCDRTAG